MSPQPSPEFPALPHLMAGHVAAYGSSESRRKGAEKTLAGVYAKNADGALRSAQLISRHWEEAYGDQSEYEQRVKAISILETWTQTQAIEALAATSVALAKVPTLGLAHCNPQANSDAALQLGQREGQDISLIDLLTDRSFLEPGRFPGYPILPHPQLTLAMDPAIAPENNAIDLASPEVSSEAPRELVDAMDRQWNSLHERGLPGQANINSLTRALYNRRGMDLIGETLDSLPGRKRVLCCTAYETPLSSLLLRSDLEELVVADLAAGARRTVAHKYGPSISKGVLRLRQMDLSGLSPDWQASQIHQLARPSLGRKDLADHLAQIGSGDVHQPLPFPDDSFDAIHAPFLFGSLHLGPVTAALSGGQHQYVDLSQTLGDDFANRPEMTEAMLVTANHSIAEMKRVLVPGGILVLNMWARPIEIDGKLLLKFSDTHLSPARASELVAGLHHDFSGNPQPTLPLSLGHILTYAKPRPEAPQ